MQRPLLPPPTLAASSTLDRLATITDPTGRFERSHELLGRGAYKEVYKAFDQEEGVEVAWNQLRVNISEKNAVKILSEIQILQSLKNEHIINFYHSWIERDPDTGAYAVFFITELMTSGTLKSYIKKTKGPLKPKVYKNWCRQILRGLIYLHSRSPPIIHRDLKCDNIFINGNNGQAKIGDLGLAIFKDKENLSSVLGTPEFMAPELYDEKYDEKVDIYSFGLCVLEMISKEYPYSECENAAQIFRKVTQGIKPQSLNCEMDIETRAFIELCINFDPKQRPSAEELLASDFLHCVPPDSTQPLSATEEDHSSPQDVSASVSAYILSIDPPNIQFKLIYTPIKGLKNCQEIKFHFNLESDTVSEVVSEMVRENVLPESARSLTENSIRAALDRVIGLKDESLKSNVTSVEHILPTSESNVIASSAEQKIAEPENAHEKNPTALEDISTNTSSISPLSVFPAGAPLVDNLVSESFDAATVSKISSDETEEIKSASRKRSVDSTKERLSSPIKEAIPEPIEEGISRSDVSLATDNDTPKIIPLPSTARNRIRSKTHDSFQRPVKQSSLATFKGILKKSADFGRILNPEITNLLEKQKLEIEILLKTQEDERIMLLEKLQLKDESSHVNDDGQEDLDNLQNILTSSALFPSSSRGNNIQRSAILETSESFKSFIHQPGISMSSLPAQLRSASASEAHGRCSSTAIGDPSVTSAVFNHYNTIHSSSPCQAVVQACSLKATDAIIERQLKELENFRATSASMKSASALTSTTIANPSMAPTSLSSLRPTVIASNISPVLFSGNPFEPSFSSATSPILSHNDLSTSASASIQSPVLFHSLPISPVLGSSYSQVMLPRMQQPIASSSAKADSTVPPLSSSKSNSVQVDLISLADTSFTDVEAANATSEDPLIPLNEIKNRPSPAVLLSVSGHVTSQ